MDKIKDALCLHTLNIVQTVAKLIKASSVPTAEGTLCSEETHRTKLLPLIHCTLLPSSFKRFGKSRPA